MAKEGRPIKYTEEVIEDIRLNMEAYIEMTDIPIVEEFAYSTGVRKQRLYEFASDSDKFSDSIKRLIEKKIAQLERRGLADTINTTMAIFSLKQLGWSDKTEIKTEEKKNVEITFVEDADD